ncbi:MAG: hypothetical protein U0892_10635 [Pirellulales bacterium]
MPRHKGKVERGVGYVKSNALKVASSLRWLNRTSSSITGKALSRTLSYSWHDEATCAISLFKLRSLLSDHCLPIVSFYEEGRRKVCRDGHIQIQRAFPSPAPEYLGRIVWVRWNSRISGIPNDRMEQIAIHSARERGFSTHTEHIAPEKIRSIEKGIEFFLRKVHFIGPSAVRWAELLVEEPEALKHRVHYKDC